LTCWPFHVVETPRFFVVPFYTDFFPFPGTGQITYSSVVVVEKMSLVHLCSMPNFLISRIDPHGDLCPVRPPSPVREVSQTRSRPDGSLSREICRSRSSVPIIR